MAKDAYYFPHDQNARGDEKVVAMRRKIGWSGYGLYWAIVEKMYEASGKLAADYDSLAFDLQAEPGMVKAIVENFGLFYTKAGKIGSVSVDRRLKQRRMRSTLAMESAERRWGPHRLKKKDANALPPHSTSDANAMLEIKEKKRKENETKEKEIKIQQAARPALADVRLYCLERKNSVDPEQWLAYYESNGWKVGRNPMKDWRAAVRTWEKNQNGRSEGNSKKRVVGTAATTPGKYAGI